jgi:hypothetical protein
MTAQNVRFKKKFALAILFWASGTVLAFYAKADLGTYTAFTTVVCGLFKAADVADKKLNNGSYS